jgi:hypothetical protein
MKAQGVAKGKNCFLEKANLCRATAWETAGRIGLMKRGETAAAKTAEGVRVRRLREDARRPISVNLAETIALSHELIKMADAAKRR